MNEDQLKKVLRGIQKGKISPDEAFNQLRDLPMEKLSCARLDHHRSIRTGIPEVVYGKGKSSSQLIEILSAMLKHKDVVISTRISKKKATAVRKRLPILKYYNTASMLIGNEKFITKKTGRGTITIISAGTADFKIAEEARLCLSLFGHPTYTIYDAGVAGIHRIMPHYQTLQSATAIIVVAGMDGALPSVVAGMTATPVVAVPTSTGYGTGIGGISALLSMLNSCSPGLAVVNIDNGFGAACMAAAINNKA